MDYGKYVVVHRGGTILFDSDRMSEVKCYLLQALVKGADEDDLCIMVYTLYKRYWQHFNRFRLSEGGVQDE